MDTWTLEVGSETKTLEAWGVTLRGWSEVSFAPGEITLETCEAFDADAQFAFRAEGILRQGEDIVFRGRFDEPERLLDGHVERLVYSLKDLWWHLQNLPFVQSIPVGLSSELLFGNTRPVPLFNSGRTIEQEITAVVEYAADKGVAVQMGSIEHATWSPVQIEREDGTCASMLLTLRRFVPDMSTQIDYSTTPPTLNFIRRIDAAEHTLPIPADPVNVRLRAERGIQASEVVIRYVITNEVDGSPQTVVSTDAWPEGSTGESENAVISTVNLRGFTSVRQKQELFVRAIQPNSKSWWTRLYPWLADATFHGSTTVDTGTRTEEGGGSAGLINEVEGGAVPAWLSASTGTSIVKARAVNFTYKGVYYGSYELRATVHATSLGSDTYYSEPEITPGDTAPAGVAEAYYSAVSVLHYSGTLRYTDDELPNPRVRVGDVINLSGGNAVARGWSTMRGQVQRVEQDVGRATWSITLGPPAHLSLADLQSMMNPAGSSWVEPDMAATDFAGPLRHPNNNSAPVPTSGDAPAPWSVSEAGVVSPATVNSLIPTIGGTPIMGYSGDPPALTLPSSGVCYMALTFACTWGAGDFLANATLTGVALGVLTSPPTDVFDTTSVVYQPFCNITGGEPGLPIPSNGMLTARLCGTGALTASLVFDNA